MEQGFINPLSIFKITITVQPDDIDALNHVNNVVYLRYVQDVAASHWNTIAPEGFKQQYAWVVLRHEIDYKNMAVLGDSIIAETWVGSCEGPRSERHVELYHATTRKLLVKAKTSWCLLDSTTLRPKRIEQEIIDLFSSPH